MNFNAEFIHKPGRENIADYMSRHPVEEPSDLDYEDMAHILAESALPDALSRNKLCKATAEDKQLTAMCLRLESKKLSSMESELVKPFEGFINEMSRTEDGFVLRENKLVIPFSLQIAHEGHLGRSKTKSLLSTNSLLFQIKQLI